MPARLHVFGAPHLRTADGRRVDLPLERPTSLLVLLALRADWVWRSELAALYRPDAPEDEALAYLRKLVFRARRMAGEGLAVEGARVRWVIGSDVVDFRAALSRGDDAAALAHYAAPLLGGASFAGVDAVQAWLDLERSDLAGAWRASALRHAEARLASGDATAAWRAAEAVRAADPFDEEALQVSMRALLAQGRSGAAWSAFEGFRTLLGRELQAAPLEGTLTLADLVRPAPRAVPGAPPVDGALVGRGDELVLAARWWTEGARWITLAGLGGVGKTRLAIEVAHRVVAGGGRAAFVAAAGLERVDDVALAIAAALGVDVGGGSAPRDAVAAQLRRRQLHLVLDDLPPAAAVDVAAWFEAIPDARVVATARAPFDLPHEWLIDVRGLGVPPEGAEADPGLHDAVRLFLTRAERRAALPLVGRGALEAVARLCRRVDGLPLALELAAAWTRVASVEALLERLDRDVATLAVDAPDVAPRHRDLVAVVGASLDLVVPEERATLERLAAFDAGFGAAAGERVAAASLARLLRFVNLGLVGRAAHGRYRLHPVVRDVVLRAVAPEQRAAARADVRRDVAALLRAAAVDLTRGDEQAALRALAPEADAIRAAWRDALAERDVPSLGGMEEGLYLMLDARAAYHEGAAAFEAALAVVPPDARGARSLLARSGYFAMRIGLRDRAAARLAAAGAEGADAMGAFVLRTLATLDLLAGRYADAAARYASAHERSEALDDLDGAARAANNLAVLGQYVGDLEGAAGWARRALGQSQALGSLRGVGGALTNLGVSLEGLGAHDEAEEAYRASMAAYLEAADPRGEAAAWTNLGHLAERRGDDAAAAASYARGLALKRDLGDPLATAISLVNLADVQGRRGAGAAAREGLREALRLALDAGGDVVLARALWSVARERAAAGEPESAVRIADTLIACATAEAWVRTSAAEARAAWAAAARRVDGHAEPEQLHALATRLLASLGPRSDLSTPDAAAPHTTTPDAAAPDATTPDAPTI